MSKHLLIGSLALALLAGTASADTLREALVSTYASNPIPAEPSFGGPDEHVIVNRATPCAYLCPCARL